MSLEIYVGPMFSGKTSTLINELNCLHDLNFKVLLIGHSIDTRSDQAYSTHNSLIKGLNIFEQIKTNFLMNILDKALDYEVIGIDEAQFFDSTIVKFVKILLDKNKKVFVSSLDGTSQMDKFGYTLDLIPLADTIKKLTAKCVDCLNEGKLVDAPFTKKISENDSIIDVGTSDKYKAVCRLHHKH